MAEKQVLAAAQPEKQERVVQTGGFSESAPEHREWQARLRRGATWLRKGGFAALAFVIGTLSGSNHPLFRILRLAPVVHLLKGEDTMARDGKIGDAQG